jgi:hypothetical protein
MYISHKKKVLSSTSTISFVFNETGFRKFFGGKKSLPGAQPLFKTGVELKARPSPLFLLLFGSFYKRPKKDINVSFNFFKLGWN